MKNKKYWLRGGVVGLLLGIIIVVYFLKYNFLACSTGWGAWQKPLPSYCYLLFPINGSLSSIYGILNILLYFVYGAILGLLYGKIKNKD